MTLTPRMRHLPGLVALLAVSLWLSPASQVVATLPVTAPAQPESRSPNILVILTDDLDVGMMAHLPGLRALVADPGATFTNFFVSNALCCPSRVSILRGQYAYNHRVQSNTRPSGGYLRFRDQGLEQSTIATWLQDAGYTTGMVGKYMNEHPTKEDRLHIPPGWDNWYSEIDGNVTLGFNFALNENGASVIYRSGEADYYTDVLAGHADTVLRRMAARPAPFFLMVAPSAPHEPAIPAPRHQGAFPDTPVPRPPSYNEADVSDKPAWVQENPLAKETGLGQLDRLYRDRLRSMLAVQEMVERLIATLEETGQLERTYIIFTSDNGYHYAEHRLHHGKETGYEEDIRVPFYVRGPGIAAGRTVERLALNIDLAPTFAAMAGIPPPAFVDGRSLLPLVRAGPAPASWRQGFAIDHSVPGASQKENHSIPAFVGLRTLFYTYIEYETGERELYDLRTDPYELDNVVERSDPPTVEALAVWLQKMRQCAGQTCREAEDYRATAVPVPHENGVYAPMQVP